MRRLASASPVSCAGAVLWKSQARTSRHLRTPNRLARIARLLPRPSRRSWRREIPPRRTSPRSLKYWGRFRSTFPKPRRQAAARVRGSATPRAGGRLSAAAGCGEHTVRWSPAVTATGGRRDYRNRGQRHRWLAAVGTIALRQCDRRASGAVRGRRTAEFGRKHERRTSRPGRDPDARFSTKRSSGNTTGAAE